MKTSNKLIVAGILCTIICLVAYDCMLRAAYRTGAYKLPYSNFVNLPYIDFDVVDAVGSTAANIRFVQGPFNVRVDRNALEYVRIAQNGRELTIKAAFEENYRWNPNDYVIIISCPTLLKLVAGATYEAGNRFVTDSTVRSDWTMRRLLIENFTLDSLELQQDYGSTVVLTGNQIRSVHASIGLSKGSGSKLIISDGNRMDRVSLDIMHRSKLELGNAVINQLNYQLSPDAQLIVNGNAQSLFNQLKPVIK